MMDVLVGLCLVTGASVMVLLGLYLWLLIQKEHRDKRLHEELEAAREVESPTMDRIYGGM